MISKIKTPDSSSDSEGGFPFGDGNFLTHDGSTYRQDPVAVIGMANRLPGDSNNPTQLWDFLAKGGVAKNDPPASRFSLSGHYDGSLKPHTIRTPGAMFLENIDPADFDASFFNINRADAIAMDPQQRQLLEVVYEGFENAGVTLEQASGSLYGCFVGSYAVDYQDMQFRDPEDRATGITVGAGRAILSNRISHFFNLKGASFTIDTACSGSAVAVDVACRYLHTRQIDGAVVAGANLYMSPDQNQDMGAMRVTSSATGKCHTFDAKADGYCKAEAINAVILKRLSDAIRDGDPIRAVIIGTSTNSDGWTPGIASPSADAQATAIRAAYAAAGLDTFDKTGYLECHGTGTLAGDPIEVSAAASVFSSTRSKDNPLIIGSLKSNIGHSEPGAGISGLLKAIMAVENGIIPGNPTFIDPNPKIDFEAWKVRATRTAIPWPKDLVHERIASVNSFGYGGSNAHVIIQDAPSYLKKICKHVHQGQISSFAKNDQIDDFFSDDEEKLQPHVLVFSANDAQSLKAYAQLLKKHLLNPRVNIKLPDLAYTLSEKRSRHFNRGYVITRGADFDEGALVFGKRNTKTPRIGFVMTGQGAQWSQMGKSLLETFPAARKVIERLDFALQSLPAPPSWSLYNELVYARSPERLRLPEFSQPLVTALQLAILAVLSDWGVYAQSVVGHSSGEIAGACSAGLLSPEDAIKIAFYRGQAANDLQEKTDAGLGMMAVGLGAERALDYVGDEVDSVQIACYNSPGSVTMSGKVSALEKVKARLQNEGHFARLLQVNLAYHSKFMAEIGDYYETLLQQNIASPFAELKSIKMFSSVTGKQMDEPAASGYWKRNMVQPVRFDQACGEMLAGPNSAELLIEIGPSGALSGPISQIKKEMPGQGSGVQYFAAAKRGPDCAMALYDLAGRIFLAGGTIDLTKVNAQSADVQALSTIVDLPNYSWNHSTKYWHESDASKDWRFRPFVHHDLLGSKILGTPWNNPTFKKSLDLKDVPWLKDHKMGSDIIFPGAGYIAMAVEALYQSSQSVNPDPAITSADQLCYRLRNVKFDKALVLEEESDAKVMLTLAPQPGPINSWYDFKIFSSRIDVRTEHCWGLIRLEKEAVKGIHGKEDLSPLKHASSANLWYKSLNSIGYGFGPAFQKQLEVEAIMGQQVNRSYVSLTEPQSKWSPQSPYPMHPACLDGCFQTVVPSLWAGDRSAINAVLLPAIVDDLLINPMKTRPEVGLSVANSHYTGRGRRVEGKNYASGCSVYDPETGALLVQMTGLHYHKLDTGETGGVNHVYNHSAWRPDINFISQNKISSLAALSQSSTIDQVLDLIAHKKPSLKVMEVNLRIDDSSSTWFTGRNKSIRDIYHQYSFVSSNAKSLIDIQSTYESRHNTSFNLFDFSKPEGVPKGQDIDFLIVKDSAFTKESISVILQNAHDLFLQEAKVLFIEQGILSPEQDSHSIDEAFFLAQLNSNGFSNVLSLPSEGLKSAHLATITRDADHTASRHNLNIVYLTQTLANKKTKLALEQLGWSISEHRYPFEDLTSESVTLVVDELSAPVLTMISQQQWDEVKLLIEKRSKILWVTEGSQLSVSKPDKALIHGFFRTIRAEDKGLRLTTLDVDSATGPATLTAIDTVLKYLQKPSVGLAIESEFVERDGIIYINRVLPDPAINKKAKDDTHGAEPVVRSLHEMETVAKLHAERLGTLDALCYAETSSRELPILDNHVEVELYAAGLNFKDVAVTMGIFPENEHLLGHEGAGIVRRVGKGAEKFKIGDRVAVIMTGTFANRIQSPAIRTHILSDSMSFEDASTMPLVYMTSIYSLFDLAKLQKGQSVLIHSAAGGIGIACINLAQYIGAEIYVTVSTDEKRKFLEESFGIKPDRMFSSRTTEFASKIMQATGGKGVDVIINSLIGDLLDESWRICATGGSMVEIGKKDIIERNALSMEPFERNCSFRAADLSHVEFPVTIIASLLEKTFKLAEAGHIKPIHPIKTFSFDKIPEAFAYMRSGRHIGKIVVTDSVSIKIEVPVRPATEELAFRKDASYLIVGGLRGLCGSLAIFLAKKGASSLIIMSRSGGGDDRSLGIIRHCEALGCKVLEVKGDVSNSEDVQQAFEAAPNGIAGVIQGSMVLRDKPYELMDAEEYHAAIGCKVQGTWNLHNATLEQSFQPDFFTLLSSISGIVGQKGQANYAAGNVFMDAFAVYRRSLGFTANSIDLGIIEDVGYIAEHDMNSLVDDSWTRINEGLLRKILEYSILQQSSSVINQASVSQLIAGIAVPQPADSVLLHDARFSGLFISDDFSTQKKGANDGSKDIQALLLLKSSNANVADILASAVEVVNKQFTKTLRLEEPMEPAKSLSTYGLDSLSAVEFRNWVRLEIGAELTLLDITNAASLYALCEKIISKIAV